MPMMAEDYIIIGKESKVFDTPDASKGYVTLNQKNQEVIIKPGMVFKTLENSKGWHMIEYSPGLRGYLSEQVASKTTKKPLAGVYVVSNNPKIKLTIENTDGKWNASAADKKFHGTLSGNAIIFLDDNKHPAYSVVDLGEGPIVMTYDNNTTNFF